MLRTPLAIATGLLLVLLGVAPVFGLFGNDSGLLDHENTKSARSEVLDVAKKQVIDLTTLNADNVGDKIQAMSKRSTGNFKTQIGGMAPTLTDTVDKNAVKAIGAIDAAGIVSLSARKAEVIVASSARVENSKAKGAQPRSYRVSVQLERAKGSGPWLVSNMGFVG